MAEDKQRRIKERVERTQQLARELRKELVQQRGVILPSSAPSSEKEISSLMDVNSLLECRVKRYRKIIVSLMTTLDQIIVKKIAISDAERTRLDSVIKELDNYDPDLLNIPTKDDDIDERDDIEKIDKGFFLSMFEYLSAFVPQFGLTIPTITMPSCPNPHSAALTERADYFSLVINAITDLERAIKADDINLSADKFLEVIDYSTDLASNIEKEPANLRKEHFISLIALFNYFVFILFTNKERDMYYERGTEAETGEQTRDDFDLILGLREFIILHSNSKGLLNEIPVEDEEGTFTYEELFLVVQVMTGADESSAAFKSVDLDSATEFGKYTILTDFATKNQGMVKAFSVYEGVKKTPPINAQIFAFMLVPKIFELAGSKYAKLTTLYDIKVTNTERNTLAASIETKFKAIRTAEKPAQTSSTTTQSSSKLNPTKELQQEQIQSKNKSSTGSASIPSHLEPASKLAQEDILPEKQEPQKPPVSQPQPPPSTPTPAPTILPSQSQSLPSTTPAPLYTVASIESLLSNKSHTLARPENLTKDIVGSWHTAVRETRAKLASKGITTEDEQGKKLTDLDDQFRIFAKRV